MMKVAVGYDHGGFEIREHIISHLKSKGFTVVDMGTQTPDSCDYPIFAKSVAHSVAAGECDYGVLCCGTGIGMSIAANKVNGIRCAVCSEPFSARLTKQHNNANIIAFGARVVGIDMAKMILDEFFDSNYQGTEMGGERHKNRVALVDAMDSER